jgi:hypothetical protein
MANAQFRLKKKIVKKKRVQPTNRSNATRVLAQGTGHTVARAFGGGQKTNVPRSLGLPNGCWDAFHSAHAALPRSVGPYTVVRTTKLVDTTSKFSLIGTFRRHNSPNSGGGDSWSNCVLARSAMGATGAIGTTSATEFVPIPFPGAKGGMDSTFTCCPAAISVQVMCTDAISAAAGQLAAAVIPARLDLSNDTRTYGEIEDAFVSYFRPRLLSAGKLALRGVQLDSHPLSMADVSEFLPMTIDNLESPATPWNDTSALWHNVHPTGWAPMVVYNPTNAPLALLITVEWRVRFDIANPAVSSHTHHGVSSDMAWDQGIRRATAALPGVLDIVERVANTGLNLARAYGQGAAALA